jgi:hypothetical protein
MRICARSSVVCIYNPLLVVVVGAVEIVARVSAHGCNDATGPAETMNGGRPHGIRVEVVVARPERTPEIGCAARPHVCEDASHFSPNNLLLETRVSLDYRARGTIRTTELSQILTGQAVQNIEREVRRTAWRRALFHYIYMGE